MARTGIDSPPANVSSSGLRRHSGGNADLGYHARLLDDKERTEAFFEALNRTVRPGMKVLDVGTGSGILAMHAARLGADVHAVESTDMIGAAEMSAAKNDLRIHFRQDDFLTIEPSEFPQFDIIVSEMIGNMLLDENILALSAHARKFLAPGGQFIPESVRFRTVPAWSEVVKQAGEFWGRPMYGFDFSHLADHQLNHFLLESSESVEVFGPVADLSEILVKDMEPAPFHDTTTFCFEKHGEINAVWLWWSACLTDDLEYEPSPGKETHWYRALLPVEPRSVSPADELPFKLGFSSGGGEGIWSWALDGDARSTLFALPPTKSRLKRMMNSE